MAVLPVRQQWTSPLLLLIASLHIQSAYALSIAYCSTQNTGGGGSPDFSIYQSNGRCHDLCVNGNYAFAILQNENCWCSNYIPAVQQSTSKCDSACPGYPDDLCGNEAQGLYGYIALNVAASGTLGAASSTTTTSPQVVANIPSTDPIKSTPKSSHTPTPVTNVQVVTLSGVIVTQTVTTTPILNPNSFGTPRKSSGGIAPGYIAAAVIAGVFGLAFIFAGAYLYWRRSKGLPDSEFGASNRDMQRNVSVHSKAGLLANKLNAPVITTRLSNHGLVRDDGSHSSPVSERRRSQPLMYDQRLNPNALMANDNGSHTSLKTLDDHRDYGRTLLKVMNPDAAPERPNSS